MKKVYFIIYILVVFFTFSWVGCKEDELAPLPETVPLVATLNRTDFVMGDKVEITLSVDRSKNEKLVANEDFAVRFSAKKSGTEEDVTATLFEEFPATVMFRKGEASLTVAMQVKKEGISEMNSVDLGIFVRGYLFGKSMSSDTKTIHVSDYHHTTLSIKENPNKEIKEGEKFVLVASVSTEVKSPLEVNIVPGEGEEKYYDGLPEKLIISAGSSRVESNLITLKKDNQYTGNIDLTLNLSVNSSNYPLSKDKFVFRLMDIDQPLGDKLKDERWVYADPERMFMSDKNEGQVVVWKPGYADKMKEGDKHPNKELGKTWSFLNAIEFHNIPNGTNAVNSNKTTTCKFFAANNTMLAQKDAVVDNDKFSNIDKEGVIRIWGAKGKFKATGPASGSREYGSAALYASKFWEGQPNMFAVQNTRIYAGIRVEVRARCRGALHGTNPAIWLLGNSDSDVAKAWPKCGEVDILEVPTGIPGTNVAYQTFHFDGDNSGRDKSISVNKSMGANMQEWNIYWAEWRSNNEIAVGINGQETLVIRKASYDAKSWPYDMAYNPSGFKLILSLGVKNSWALGNTIPEGWDSGFATIGYEESKTSSASPRMEIDWVRYYKNTNYNCSDRIWTGGKTY